MEIDIPPNALLVFLGDDITVQAVDVIGFGRADGSLDAAADSIVNVTGGCGGAIAVGAVDLSKAIFGVIKVGVRTIVRKVSGAVVLVGRPHQLIVGVPGRT